MFTFAFGRHDRVRKAVDVSGRSVQEVADALGVHRNTLGRWMSGRTTPSRAELLALSVVTGAPVEWLETGAEPSISDEPLAA